ncbi:MAG: hypothetical protein ACXIUV_15240 [Alkalilacustris sp.]
MAPKSDPSVEERIDRLERAGRSAFPAWLRDGLALLSPIALAVIGFFFQQTLQDTRIAIEQNELEIRRIDSAQRILTAVFREEYEEARALQALFDALMADSRLRASLTDSIDAYFVARFDRIARQPTLDAAKVAELRRTVDDAAGLISPGALPADLEVELHVVLVSLIRDAPGKFARLIPIAEAITADPDVPDAEIWCSSTGIGYLALTVGRHPLESAWAVGEHVQARGWDQRRDLSRFYVTRGDHLYRRVWPGDHDPASDPCA